MEGQTARRWSSWWRAVIVGGVVAFGVAVFALGVGQVLSVVGPVLAVSAIMGTLVVLAGRSGGLDGTGETVHGQAVSERRGPGRWALYAEVVTGSVCLVLSVVVAALVSPWCILAVIAVLVATAPPVRATLHAHVCRYIAGDRPPATTAAAGGAPSSRGTSARSHEVAWHAVEHELTDPGSKVSGLNATELCHLWRTTYWTVRQVQSPAHTVQVVQLRQAVLDELEKQRPDAVGTWVTSGRHRADPARFL